MYRHPLTLSSLSLCLPLLASMAVAESPASDRKAVSLEEIVVTARRREEALQDVPVSIAALSADSLEKSSVQELENLTAVVPGFRFSYEGGANNVSMSLRGFGIIPLGEGVPSVVVYSNDVPLPKVGGNISTYDLASIQVLKGPQGTLFGRNTIGGAVLISPTAPAYEQQGYLRAGTGNYGARLLEGAANVTLVDNVAALRVAGQLRRREGTEVNRTSAGPDTNEIDQQSVRVSLRLDLSEQLSNNLVLDYTRSDRRPGSDHVVGYNPGIIAAAFTPSLGAAVAGAYEQAIADQVSVLQAAGAHHVANNFHSDGNQRSHREQTELWGLANTTELQTDSITLRNIFGYRHVSSTITANTQGVGDIDGPLGPFVIYHLASQDEKEYFSNEFQLLGGDDRLDWIAGFFYSQDNPTKAMGTSAQAFNLLAFGVSDIHTTALAENENYAVFGQLDYHLSDALTLNLGARYSWDKIEGCGVGGLNRFLTWSECKSAGVETVKADGSAPTWTLGLDYKLTDDVLLYGMYRRGYRGVNINTPQFASVFTTGGSDPACVLGAGQCPDLRAFQTVNEEQVNDFELGVKADWSVGEVVGRSNVSLFYTDYTDAVQFVSVRGAIPAAAPDNPTRSSVAVNAADMTIQGLEFELMIEPSEGLSLTLTGAFVNHRIDEINVPAIGTQLLTKDNVTLPTPEFSGTALLRYEFPGRVLGGYLSASADYFYTEKWDAQSGISLPGYDLMNTRVDLARLGDGHLGLALWCRNLLDEEYTSAPGTLQASLPAKTAFYGDPRTFGMELSYTF
ncbi:TonB-dependent receptor [Pseudomaricurvus alcaniphilus]|uniref:TonB-dependent receptor n=1 Tax=Pseudomaricurvus alcaniphilus TaxID=1166482 RepID=UPI0014075FB2|nr:TonB-dependent receptor [Pseudomaricurvus alcaniphilus]NHN38250.1 TonB-dependent receptor [Pseudomaricurvus alcaniphilus]